MIIFFPYSIHTFQAAHMEGMSKELAEAHEANKAYKKTRKVKKTKPAQECNEALEIEDNQWYSMGISLKKTLESYCKEFEQLLINILNEDFEQRAKRVLNDCCSRGHYK